MRIALICRKFWPNPGGLSFHALRLCQHLQKRGHEVQAITRLSKGPFSYLHFYAQTEAERNYVAEGVPVQVMGMSRWDLLRLRPMWRVWDRPHVPRWAFWLVNWVFTPKFLHLFRNGQYDVIHFDGSGYELWGYAALRAARKLGLPFVVQPSVHAGDWGDRPEDFAFYQQSDGLLVHSNEERDYLIAKSGVPADKIHAVFNGIDDTRGGDGAGFRERYGLRGPVVLFIGRKTEDKGYFLLREAFEHVVGEVPDAQLVMLGPKRKDVDKNPSVAAPWLVEIDDASDDEKRDALAACDLFCMPSRGESFGLGYMEAALCGKPSVARNLGVLEDLLGRHGAAKLVGKRNPGGSVDVTAQEIAAATMKLLANPLLLKDMGEKAVKQAELYLWPVIVKRFEKVYDRLVLSSARH